MFDFDAGKLLIIGVVALIVIGPKDLPRVLRQLGQAVGKLRRMASEFQGQFMDAMREADLQDIRDEVAKIQSDTKLDVHFDPARDIQRELTQAVDSVSYPTAPAPADESASTPSEPKDHSADTAFAAGIAPSAPEVEAAAVLPETAEPQPVALAPPEQPSPAQKRKITLQRRRPATVPSVEARLGPSRFRNVRPRRQEADQ